MDFEHDQYLVNPNPRTLEKQRIIRGGILFTCLNISWLDVVQFD